MGKVRGQTCRRTGKAAFTLIEIVLAIGIFALVMVAIYSCWSAVLRGSRSGLAAAAEVQRTRVAMRAIEESLSSAIFYADNPKYFSFYTDTSGKFAYLSFVSRLPESFPGSGLFPGQELRRVTFYVNTKGQFTLLQSPILEATEKIGKPYTIALSPTVSQFAMEFFDARKFEWVPEWPFTNQLPRMVRVAVDFGDGKTTKKEDATIHTIPINATPIARVGGASGGQPPGAPPPLNQPGGPAPRPAARTTSFNREGWRLFVPDDIAK